MSAKLGRAQTTTDSDFWRLTSEGGRRISRSFWSLDLNYQISGKTRSQVLRLGFLLLGLPIDRASAFDPLYPRSGSRAGSEKSVVGWSAPNFALVLLSAENLMSRGMVRSALTAAGEHISFGQSAPSSTHSAHRAPQIHAASPSGRSADFFCGSEEVSCCC